MTVLAFEQPVKPTIGRAANGQAFPAVLGLLERALTAGRPVQDLERAITAGVDVWTTQGLNTACAKARGGSGRAAARETGYDLLAEQLGANE